MIRRLVVVLRVNLYAADVTLRQSMTLRATKAAWERAGIITIILQVGVQEAAAPAPSIPRAG
jgi:hypothetical protein